MSDPIGTTLGRFIHSHERDHPGARGEFSLLLESVGLACRVIALEARKAGLADALGLTGATNVQGEQVKKLDIFSNDALIGALDHVGHCCVLASEEDEGVIAIPDEFPAGDYAVAFDPLDGSSNIESNIPVGTIFSIYRRVTPSGERGTETDFLRRGEEQVAAGYVIYGSSTMLVYTSGAGVNGFTLDPSLGAWLLTHPKMAIPSRGKTYSINGGNRPYWHDGLRSYVDALESEDPAAGRPYGHRYVGTLVADAHRTLLDGGIFMYPADRRDPSKPNGKLRLLYEGAPMAFLFEQAGGAGTDGRRRLLDVPIESLHQRTPIFLGSADDVAEAGEQVSGDPA